MYVYYQTFMMSGDMSPDSNRICIDCYRSHLQSDFYQVAHHGATGGSNEFNKICKPKYVLWPIGGGKWDTYKNHERNSWLSDPNSSVEIIFPALFQTTVIKLPFDGSESSYEIYPNQ